MHNKDKLTRQYRRTWLTHLFVLIHSLLLPNLIALSLLWKQVIVSVDGHARSSLNRALIIRLCITWGRREVTRERMLQ